MMIIFSFSHPIALIWQLMRAYTLSILTQLTDTGSPVVEKEIIDWVNRKLADGKKQSSLRSFQVIKENWFTKIIEAIYFTVSFCLGCPPLGIVHFQCTSCYRLDRLH